MTGGQEDNHRSPDDGRNLTLLLGSLRDHLARRAHADRRPTPFVLTLATSAGAWSYQHLELGRLSAICNWINLMTYVRFAVATTM